MSATGRYYRIAAPKISPHVGHQCRMVLTRRGKSVVQCDCGELVCLITRNLRRIEK